MSRFAGMTGNERLFEAGVINQWDAAVSNRDRERMIEILKVVEYSDDAALETADAVLANPATYGF